LLRAGCRTETAAAPRSWLQLPLRLRLGNCADAADDIRRPVMKILSRLRAEDSLPLKGDAREL
jgi:hypothetical protein